MSARLNSREKIRNRLKTAGKEVDSNLTPFATKRENLANIVAQTGKTARYSGHTKKFYQ